MQHALHRRLLRTQALAALVAALIDAALPPRQGLPDLQKESAAGSVPVDVYLEKLTAAPTAQRLGFREDGAPSSKAILTWPDGTCTTVTMPAHSTAAAEDAAAAVVAGATHVQRVRFLRLTPSMPSLIWQPDWFGTVPAPP